MLTGLNFEFLAVQPEMLATNRINAMRHLTRYETDNRLVSPLMGIETASNITFPSHQMNGTDTESGMAWMVIGYAERNWINIGIERRYQYIA